MKYKSSREVRRDPDLAKAIHEIATIFDAEKVRVKAARKQKWEDMQTRVQKAWAKRWGI